MTEQLLITGMAINAVLSLLYFLLCLTHVSKNPPGIFWLLILLPFIGLLAALLADVLYARGLDGERGINAERFHLEDKIYGRVEAGEDPDVIPLHDALVIHDPQTRRSIMMEILHKDPAQFIDQLKRVMEVDDTEMIHYSVTTIVEMRTMFDDELVRRDKAYQSETNNPETVADYARFLERYLDSGILDGNRQHEITIRYFQVLQRAIDLMPDELVWRLHKEEVAYELRNITAAWHEIRYMMKHWPRDERAWLATLRFLEAQRDKVRIQKLCTAAKLISGSWTPATRRAFAFWEGHENDET